VHIIPADLPAGGKRYHGTISVNLDPVDGAGAVRTSQPVSFDVHAVLEGGRARLRGTVSAAMKVECVRCLCAFDEKVERDLDVSYCRAEGIGPVDDSELDEKDLDLDYYGDDGIDLQQLLGEQILLTLPMKPLCRPDCKGLCPQCGINLNDEECSCAPDVDPRLASLGAIRDKL
jgi:uncharacterized protein